MGKKPLKESTRWFLGNEDDAEQIMDWFHGEGEIGHANWDENLEKITNAVVGTPKKAVIAMVEWCLKQRNEATLEDPFIAAVALDEWARARGFGKHAEEFDEVEA